MKERKAEKCQGNFFSPERKKKRKLQARRLSLTKENARVFLFFAFSSGEIQRKFILGKNHHRTITGTGGVRRERLHLVAVRGTFPSFWACETRLQIGARFEKREEKMENFPMLLPILSTRNFSPSKVLRNLSPPASRARPGRRVETLTYEFLVHIQRHIRIQVLLVVILAKVQFVSFLIICWS